MREHRIYRIRWLARQYRLDVIVRNHTFGRQGVDSLDADELIALHKDMESAFNNVLDGFTVDESDVRHWG